MKLNKLNYLLLSLSAGLNLCISMAHAEAKEGICIYAKYPTQGGMVVSWKVHYTNEGSKDILENIDVSIGGAKPKSLEYSHTSFKTIREVSNDEPITTYNNFALTGISNIIFNDPNKVILHIPHEEKERISDVEGKRIISLALNKKENPRSKIQLWTLTYKSATVGWHCHADLKCKVSGDEITSTAETSNPGTGETKCEKDE